MGLTAEGSESTNMASGSLLMVRGASLLSNEPRDAPIVVDGQDWYLSQILGEGTVATVFAASRGRGEPPTHAVKVAEHQLMSAQERAALQEERAIWAEVSRGRHPHIVAFEGHFATDARFCLLLELASEGELFSRVLRMSSLDESQAAMWIDELLSALEHVHALGIVHCDVKPENILLVPREPLPAAKLCDFGSACRVSRAGGGGVGGGAGAVVAGGGGEMPRGTPGYAAPEQSFLLLRGGEAAAAGGGGVEGGGEAGPAGHAGAPDIWSLGVVAYVLLSGTMPFDPTRRSACLQPPRFPRGPGGGWEAVSTDAADFISHMLLLQPSARPSAAAARRHRWFAARAAAATWAVGAEAETTPTDIKAVLMALEKGAAAAPQPLPTPTALRASSQQQQQLRPTLEVLTQWHQPRGLAAGGGGGGSTDGGGRGCVVGASSSEPSPVAPDANDEPPFSPALQLGATAQWHSSSGGGGSGSGSGDARSQMPATLAAAAAAVGTAALPFRRRVGSAADLASLASLDATAPRNSSGSNGGGGGGGGGGGVSGPFSRGRRTHLAEMRRNKSCGELSALGSMALSSPIDKAAHAHAHGRHSGAGGGGGGAGGVAGCLGAAFGAAVARAPATTKLPSPPTPPTQPPTPDPPPLHVSTPLHV